MNLQLCVSVRSLLLMCESVIPWYWTIYTDWSFFLDLKIVLLCEFGSYLGGSMVWHLLSAIRTRSSDYSNGWNLPVLIDGKCRDLGKLCAPSPTSFPPSLLNFLPPPSLPSPFRLIPSPFAPPILSTVLHASVWCQKRKKEDRIRPILKRRIVRREYFLFLFSFLRSLVAQSPVLRAKDYRSCLFNIKEKRTSWRFRSCLRSSWDQSKRKNSRSTRPVLFDSRFMLFTVSSYLPYHKDHKQ